MLTAKVVLPMDGRPAMMMSSPRCRPAVILSISVKPVDTPVMSLCEWLSISSRSIVFGRMSFNEVNPGRAPAAFRDLEHALLGEIDDLFDRETLRRMRARRDVAADLDEPAQHRALAHDLRIRADVRCTRRVLDEPSEIRDAAASLELSGTLQVLADGDRVGRLIAADELSDRAEDEPMIGAV